MAYDAVRGEMVLLDVNGDTWIWNGSVWSQPVPTTSPSVRSGASMVFDAGSAGQIVLFGGISSSCASPGLCNDTWIWNGSTWTRALPVASPPGRYFAQMAYDAATGTVVVFGGLAGSNLDPVADTWSWDGTTWTLLQPATSPPPRARGSMSYDSTTGTVILWAVGDTWSWNGSTWLQLQPPVSPEARDSTVATYDPALAAIVLFGGSTGHGDLGGHLALGSAGAGREQHRAERRFRGWRYDGHNDGEPLPGSHRGAVWLALSPSFTVTLG